MAQSFGPSLLAGAISDAYQYQATAQQQAMNTFTTAGTGAAIGLGLMGTTQTTANMDYATYLQQQRSREQMLYGESKPIKIKLTGKILLDLRREIDDWHGDILRAA